MNVIENILIVLLIGLIIIVLYANIWGQNHCKKADGNWVSMNGGKYCVDSNFREINIYK